MTKSIPLLSLMACLALTSPIEALDVEDVATFDRYVINPEELFYPEDSDLVPKRSFILLRNFRPMSTPSGKRYALVTVQNQLNSRQALEPDEFVGIFANGTRRHPEAKEVKIDSGRTESFVLNFGTHRYPLVKILINNGKS